MAQQAHPSLASQRAEYTQLLENITLLETAYFEDTPAVEDTLLPLGRVLVQNKRKVAAVRREQRVFSLSSTAGGAWPEGAHGAQALVEQLMDGMNPEAARQRRRLAAAAAAVRERERAEEARRRKKKKQKDKGKH
jgi:hypothetical protein